MKHRSGRWVLLVALGVVGACKLETTTVSGPQGEKGDKGEQGVPGMPGMAGMVDPTELAALKAQIDALQMKVAALEKQAAEPDCPAGYTVSPNPATPLVIRCVLGPPGQEHDEVVKVGSGGSAFWIDRYEASVWTDSNATMGVAPDVPFGSIAVDFPSNFPANGQVTEKSALLHARSRKGVVPSRFITWFQSQAACATSGKRLPMDHEWQLAAMGTPDPKVPSDGTNGTCLTQNTNTRMTGAAKADVNCASVWGAEDMIGNLAEWTENWYVSVGNLSDWSYDWGADYADDGMRNIVSGVYNNNPGGMPSKLPAASLRGGAWGWDQKAGVFAMNLGDAPTVFEPHYGFRCVIPR